MIATSYGKAVAKSSDPEEFFTVQLTIVLQKMLKGIPIDKAMAVANTK